MSHDSPVRRKLPSFIHDMCNLTIRKPKFKDNITLTQTYVSRRDAAMSEATEEGGRSQLEIEREAAFTNVNIVHSQQQDVQSRLVAKAVRESIQGKGTQSTTTTSFASSSTPAVRPAVNSSAASSASASTPQLPLSTPQLQSTPSQQSQTSASQTGGSKKLTPAMRAALAKEAEEAKLKASQQPTSQPPPPASAAPSRPAAAFLSTPAPKPAAPVAAPAPVPPKPAPKPVAAPPPAAAKPAPPKPAAAATKPKTPARKQCAYGAACYRKNPQHRIDEAHPGDEDWNAGGGGGGGGSKKNKHRDDDDDDYDDEDVEMASSSRPSLGRSRSTRKKVNYREEPENSDEEAMFEEPENTQDRDFIADSDEELEAGDSDDDWGESTKKKKKKAKKGAHSAGKNKKKKSVDDDDDEDYVEKGGDSSSSSDEDIPLEEEELPKCKYGAACIRKNPMHFKEERHPHVYTDMTPKPKKVEKSSKRRDDDDDDDEDGGYEDEEEKRPKKKTRVEPQLVLEKKKTPPAAAPTLARQPSQPKPLVKAAPAPAPPAAAPAPVASPPAAGGMGGGLNALPTIFNGLEAYVYGDVAADVLRLIRRFWTSFDGELADHVSAATTHIIADCAVDSGLKKLANDYPDCIIVRSQWAVESIAKKQLLSETAFIRKDVAADSMEE